MTNYVRIGMCVCVWGVSRDKIDYKQCIVLRFHGTLQSSFTLISEFLREIIRRKAPKKRTLVVIMIWACVFRSHVLAKRKTRDIITLINVQSHTKAHFIQNRNHESSINMLTLLCRGRMLYHFFHQSQCSCRYYLLYNTIYTYIRVVYMCMY